MHGLVPPHPGPLTAIDYLDADLGLTLALGVAVAIPTVILAGPVFAKYAGRWVDVPAPDRSRPAAPYAPASGGTALPEAPQPGRSAPASTPRTPASARPSR